MDEKKKKGFAAMDKATQLRLASMGGKKAHAIGKAHRFTSAEAKEAGRKGGQKVSQDRRHMSRIGTMGGRVVSEDREHMSDIGRKGGGMTPKGRNDG